MVLDMMRFLQHQFEEQSQIHHFPGSIKVGKPAKLKDSVKNTIQKKFGKLFLEDANFIVIATPKDLLFDENAIAKFSRLAGRVFGLEEIKESEIRKFGVNDPGKLDEGEEDAEDAPPAPPPEDDLEDKPEDDSQPEEPVDSVTKAKYLMLKVTTK